MGQFAFVVIGQTLFQILRDANLVLLSGVNAFDQVNVSHIGNVYEKPSYAKATDGILRAPPCNASRILKYSMTGLPSEAL